MTFTKISDTIKTVKEKHIALRAERENVKMRKFEIYGEIGENEDTLSFKNFMREIGKRINADDEIIEAAKRCNIEFLNELKKIIENPENELFVGTMIADLERSSPRYSFIKNLEYNGEKYEAEIDLLRRRFYLHRV